MLADDNADDIDINDDIDVDDADNDAVGEKLPSLHAVTLKSPSAFPTPTPNCCNSFQDFN
jgi:hypothetical protein